MKLKIYLEKAGIKSSEFAKKLKVPSNYFYQWLSSGIVPVRYWYDIEMLTKEEVTLKDLWIENYGRKNATRRAARKNT